jgi:hypothetical protein
MAITTNAIANSFKKELLEGKHNFTASTGDKFKLALYTSSATLGKSTTAFTSTNQVAASGSYVSGGGALVNAGTSLASNTAIVDFNNLSFTSATITARGALIYNTSNSNTAVCVLNFSTDKSSTSGTFTIQFPAFTTSAAIIRIA